jgi:L-iditol 2-dehydrogenase
MSAEERVLLPLSYVQNREIELTGTYRYANTYPTAIALAAAGTVRLDDIVTGHYGLGEVEQALGAGRRDPLAVKPVVVPGQ